MDAVKAFNNELASLYESKPPVSRAKMAGITKSAIKAVKFYKHVVQSVEKFILKCRSEYKVPGLYVIDSIVRQSRHHFGAEKDVFAQRFSKNIVSTFQNLCSCPPEERSKIVRVLHLWQKNSVFSSDVIQQLLKMVEQEESISPAAELFDESQTSQRSGASDEIVGTELLSTSDEQRNSRPTDEVKSTGVSVVDHFGPNEDKVSSGSRCLVEGDPGAGLDVQTNVLSSVIQLLQSQQPSSQLLQQQILQQLPQQLLQSGSLSLPQQLLQQLSSASEPHQQQQQQQHPVPASLSFAAAPFSPVLPSSVPLPPAPSPSSHQVNTQQRQPEQPSIPLSEPQSSIAHPYDRRSEENSQGSEPRFNKSLLEFDYGESDEDDNRQIRPRMEEIIRPPTPTEDDPQGHPNHQFHAMDPSAFFTTHKMEEMPPGHHLQQQQQHLDQQQPPLPLLHSFGPLLPDRPLLPPGETTVERHDYFRHGSREEDWQNEDDNGNYGRSFRGGFDARQSSGWRELDTSTYENADHMGRQRHQQDYDDNRSRDRSRHRDHDDRKRRRSRDRSPRQQHGHSRGDRESSRRSRSRDRRRRSRSRDRGRRSRSRSQDRIREREKRERERERRNRGLPPIEDQHISVCSTTLWIGHLSKHTKENELKEELSKYGEVTSFNLIPPRGCSYVSFGSRREAARALEKLRGSKLLGNVLKVAWAMGVGMKGSEFKDSWDVGQGVSYIPWDRIPEDLDSLADGGFLDEDTLPETVKIARREKLKEMLQRQSAVVSEPESLALGSINVIQVSADAPTAPPPPLPALPPGIVPPLLPPPPGFVPSMMVPGTVPAMMRLPPPMMHGPMPPGMAAPPPPSSRPALPATTSTLESVSAGEPSPMALGRHHGMASEGMPPIPPPDPPGMGFGWQVHPNMRPGMVPFRPQLPPPFIPPGPFGHRIPFPSPLPPQFQGSGDPKTDMENPEDEPMEPADGEKVEDKEERLESSIPLPPGGPPPRLPSWPSMGVSRPPNGPPPEFMGGRPRAPFGPLGGFPAPLLPLPGGRLGRSEEEELEDGIGGRDDGMNEDDDMDEPTFPGPEAGRGLHPRGLAGPMRGVRPPPPWFDFRDGPRGPPGGPRAMRIPGPPRFPFDERGMGGIGRPPPFRIRGPPSVMGGDDQRFGVPSPMGLRGRPPFPPRRPGMQNFRGHRPPMMDQPPFGQPRFGDRGPRPLFPHGFGRPSANDEMECYDESLEGSQTDRKKDWNKGQEEEEEEEEEEVQWQGKVGDRLGEMGSQRRQQRGGGERGRWEGAEVNWSRGNRREDDRERGGRWTDRGRREVEEEEEGGEGRQRSRRRRDEDTGFWSERHREQQWTDRGVETTTAAIMGRRPRSAARGEPFDARDETAGLEEAKEVNSPPVPAKSEKRPRKTRWSSAVVDPVEPSETGETRSGAAAAAADSSDTVSGPFAAEGDSVAAAAGGGGGAHLDSCAVGEQ